MADLNDYVGAPRRAWLNPPTEGSESVKAASTAELDIRSTLDLNGEEESLAYDKSNVLIIGPTGSGKFE